MWEGLRFSAQKDAEVESGRKEARRKTKEEVYGWTEKGHEVSVEDAEDRVS